MEVRPPHPHAGIQGLWQGAAIKPPCEGISPKEWLLGFMRAGVDCVAVTDHNSGDWIDPLKHALQ